MICAPCGGTGAAAGCCCCVLLQATSLLEPWRSCLAKLFVRSSPASRAARQGSSAAAGPLLLLQLLLLLCYDAVLVPLLLARLPATAEVGAVLLAAAAQTALVVALLQVRRGPSYLALKHSLVHSPILREPAGV